jgi:hypothetical protein
MFAVQYRWGPYLWAPWMRGGSEWYVLRLAETIPVNMHTEWRHTWRHHVQVVRRSIDRVMAKGTTALAQQDADLSFFISQYAAQLTLVVTAIQAGSTGRQYGQAVRAGSTGRQYGQAVRAGSMDR